MEATVESGHDLARDRVVDARQVSRVQPLEEQGTTSRVGPQQPDGASTTPQLEREGLELRLVVAVEGRA